MDQQTPARLRAIRESTRLSLRRWADHLKANGHPYSHAALSYYETGTREIPHGLIQMYEEIAAAHTTGDPITELITLGRSDVDRRTFLRTAPTGAAIALTTPPLTPSPTAHTLGTTDIAAVRAWVDTATNLDERYGGGFGRHAVETFCATDIPHKLTAQYTTDHLRRDMLSTCAEAVYLAGWKAQDTGQHHRAERYYHNAHAIATAADTTHAAWIMRIICHQAFALGHGQHHIDMAEHACRLTNGKVEPHTQALFTIAAARAHATAGNHRQAHQLITQTETQLNQPPDTPPRWAAPTGPAGGPLPARIHNQIGITLTTLGDLPGAEAKARDGLELWDRTNHPRIWAITLSRVAQAQYDQGHIADAQTTWRHVLPHLDGIDSDRIAKIRATAEQHLTRT